MSRIKKKITAMMMVSVLSLWFASPDVAHAQTVSIEGRNVYVSFSSSSSNASATISYTEGSGQVTADVIGHSHYIDAPAVLGKTMHNRSSNPTPGGASASVSAPEGCSFITVISWCKYEVYIDSTTYTGEIPHRMDF